MRKCQLCICVLLILISQSYIIPVSGSKNASCLEDEYWNPLGFCCNKCHAGFKLKKKCPEVNTRSECVRCRDGTYLDKPNFFENCFTCKKCTKPHFIEKSKCTRESNTVCGCEKGYYKNILFSSEWECSRCKECGLGQLEIKQCTEEQNTRCECKENHYPAKDKKYCIPCIECQEGCKHLCTPSTTPVIQIEKTITPSETLPKILVPVCACITVVALGVFMLYEGIRLWRKRNRALSSQTSSAVPEDQTLIITVPPDTINKSDTFVNQPCESEQQRTLPDCVPREIKIHEFFYFVLDEVPIGRFKELVRRLGVSEQNIERAEQDHRNCKDAQYHMLKVWSDSGSGGGNNVLPCHRIQMFIETLRDMYLVNCADNIENRFFPQDTSAS